MTIPVARAWLNAGGPVCKPGGMSSDRAAPTRSSCVIHCKEQSETMGIDPAPVPTAAGWQSATPAGGLRHVHVPVRSGSHDAQSASRGSARARNKTRRRRGARAGWRSFGEYAFLEDSRYASQRENARARSRHWGSSILLTPTPGVGRRVFLTGNNRQYFSCKAVIGCAGRARAQGSPYSWSAQVSVE
jgi:hypothetical protein